jgi:hypothetical protein
MDVKTKDLRAAGRYAAFEYVESVLPHSTCFGRLSPPEPDTVSPLRTFCASRAENGAPVQR